MAYRGGVGWWIAVTFLSVAAIAFAVLYFKRETRIQEVETQIRNEAPQWFASKEGAGNQKVRDLIAEKVALENKIEAVKVTDDHVSNGITIPDLQSKIRDLESVIGDEGRRAEELQRTIDTLKGQVEEHKRSVRDTMEQMQEIRNRRDEEKEATIADLRNLVATQQGQLEGQTQKILRMEELIETLRKAYHGRIIELQRENHGLRQVIEKWEAASAARESIKTEQYDGKIIQCDIENKFIVVDLGKEHRVHRGMRFDVIRWRLNKWDYMGAIELTKVGTTTSQGVILDAIVQEKICPVTGWTTTDPEMRYSPFAATGANNNQAVELVKSDVVEKASMRKLDPIVVGDYITNPFYSRHRTLRFAVTGEPVYYTTREIKEHIKKHGGILHEKVDVDTDYLVLGRIPDESSIAGDEDARKRRESMIQARDTAKQYGIPIMREVELFRFLRR